MSQRTNTIALSTALKQRIDDAANDRYGTTEIPYGVALTQLIDEYSTKQHHTSEDATPA